ncbi:MAG: cobalt-precorrin-6Y C(15)-methyltransferase, partial [Sulfolobaceae archaeon]
NEKFDVIFIGGGSEVISEVISKIRSIMNKGARVVIDAILIETVNKALASLEANGFSNIDITEVIVAKGLKTKYGTAMISRNPIFIISGEFV